jgi:F0F1-type ATP synthase assembly protein I
VRRETERSGLAEGLRYLGVGVTWMLSAALCTMLGVWLDKRWGTEPVLTLAGVVVGGVAGFWYLYHQTVVVPREERNARSASGRGSDGRAARGEDRG